MFSPQQITSIIPGWGNGSLPEVDRRPVKAPFRKVPPCGRVKFNFSLNVNRIDKKGRALEAWLVEEIHRLKRTRLYSSTIRDGIMLMHELRQGRTDVLFELFPFVRELIEKAGRAEPKAVQTDLLLEQIERQNQMIEKLLLQQSALSAAYPTPSLSLDDIKIEQGTLPAASVEDARRGFARSVAGMFNDDDDDDQ